MKETSNLAKALNSLRTPEARAGAVFQLLTSDSESDYKNIEIDGLVGDTLRVGIGVAFRQKDFKRGFAMAEKGGVLEGIIQEIQIAPPEFRIASAPYGYGYKEIPAEENNKRIPELIRTLPGFNYDLTEPDFRQERERQSVAWVKELKKSLIEEVLVPKKRYEEAVEQMQQVGGMQEEISSIAIEHFSNFRMAKLVAETGTGFYSAIARAESNKMPILADWLKNKHIDALLTRKYRIRNSWGWRQEGREIDEAISRSRQYFGDERAKKTLESGISITISDLKNEIYNWQNERDSAISAYDRNFQVDGSYSKKCDLQTARTRFMLKPSQYAEKAINLISQLPVERKNEFIKELYASCSQSVFDSLGIAFQLEDRTEILNSGLRALQVTSHSPFEGYRHDIKLILEKHILSTGTKEEKLKYTQALKFEEALQKAPDLGVANELLDYWIAQVQEQEKRLGKIMHGRSPVIYSIANLAGAIGKKQISREYYIRAEEFASAAQQTEDSLDKASLVSRALIKQVDRRIDYHGHSSKVPDYYYLGRFNGEINSMNECINLAKAQKGDKTEYYTRALELARFLFEKKEYQEGVLFLKQAKIPKKVYAQALDDKTLETVEAGKDFASCYWLSMARGDKEQAGNYRLLANAMKQKIYSRLEDFMYTPPEPVRTKVQKVEERLPF